MTFLIVLNSNKFAIVDDEDLYRLLAFDWYSNSISGNITRSAYRGGRSSGISLASEIMNNPGKMYDHINRDAFDNRKSNLRPCTRWQNAANNSKRKGTSSKYKGVSWSKTSNKWLVHCHINGYKNHIGLFDSEIEAAKAYNKVAEKEYGAFAVLNKDAAGNILL